MRKNGNGAVSDKRDARSKKQKFFVAIDGDGSPVITTARFSKQACLRVLTQGDSSRWKTYQKRGYKIQEKTI